MNYPYLSHALQHALLLSILIVEIFIFIGECILLLLLGN